MGARSAAQRERDERRVDAQDVREAFAEERLAEAARFCPEVETRRGSSAGPLWPSVSGVNAPSKLCLCRRMKRSSSMMNWLGEKIDLRLLLVR